MPLLSRAARDFVEEYSRTREQYCVAAMEAKALVENVVALAHAPVHAVMARAKDVTSLRAKLRRKRYAQPARQVTDLIGLRVITYFANDLDRIDTEIRSHFDVSDRKSRDARKELAANEFGYRSVHLIARLRAGAAKSARAAHLRRHWFEIQIRSILDHAWSEIEHEVVYKSGITYPVDVRRRFMAVAGSLEVLEHSFSRLAAERGVLVEGFKTAFTAGRELSTRFDAARLLAFMEWHRPAGVGWRQAETSLTPFPASSSAHAVEALYSAHLATPKRLLAAMSTARFRRDVSDFASLEGLAPQEVSHLALVVLAVATVKPAVLVSQFPEMLYTPSIATIVAI